MAACLLQRPPKYCRRQHSAGLARIPAVSGHGSGLARRGGDDYRDGPRAGVREARRVRATRGVGERNGQDTVWVAPEGKRGGCANSFYLTSSDPLSVSAAGRLPSSLDVSSPIIGPWLSTTMCLSSARATPAPKPPSCAPGSARAH